MDCCEPNMSFYERVSDHIDEGKVIQEGLWHEGPTLIRALQDLGGFGKNSLRKVARMTSYSPTYLSRIMHGKMIMSPRMYIKLSDALREGLKRDRLVIQSYKNLR